MKKIYVVHDKKGNILSLTESQTERTAPSSEPIAQEGQTVAELDIPSESSHLSLKEIHERLRVQDGKPKFVAHKG